VSRSPNLRILITGRDGQVGAELVRAMSPLGKVTATGRAEMDLTSDAAIQEVVRRVRPQLIVNAAAYTAVDKAESERDLARRINVEAVEKLAQVANSIGAAIIHYSTDYVFDGEKSAPYVETDETNPLSVYGQTKLDGEQELANSGIPYLVLRTSWVYSMRGKNFLLTILKLAAEKPELRIVNDQIGAPTWSHDIAGTTAAIAKKWRAEEPDKTSGIYHLTAGGETSWYGFAAEAIRLRALANPSTTCARLLPILTADYPTAAARPKNSRLDCGRLQKVFGIEMPHWQNSLEKVVASIH